MAYYDVGVMVGSNGLRKRVAACAAQESSTPLADPMRWAAEHIWVIAAAPGWDAKWASGVAAYPDEDPGDKSDVITDADILAVVQPIILA
jgi:hypothetical protein